MRKQGGGAMADGVVGDTLVIPQAHGQPRLCSVHGLDLLLHVNAGNHRLVRRGQVQANDVPNARYKEEAAADLESFLLAVVRLEGLPPAVASGFGDARHGIQGLGTPVGVAVGWPGPQGPVDLLGVPVIFLGTLPARGDLLMQPFHAQFPIPLAPFD